MGSGLVSRSFEWKLCANKCRLFFAFLSRTFGVWNVLSYGVDSKKTGRLNFVLLDRCFGTRLGDFNPCQGRFTKHKRPKPLGITVQTSVRPIAQISSRLQVGSASGLPATSQRCVAGCLGFPCRRNWRTWRSLSLV